MKVFLSLSMLLAVVLATNPDEQGPYFQGDIKGYLPGLNKNGVIDERYRWDNGVVPYEIVSGDFSKLAIRVGQNLFLMSLLFVQVLLRRLKLDKFLKNMLRRPMDVSILSNAPTRGTTSLSNLLTLAVIPTLERLVASRWSTMGMVASSMEQSSMKCTML